jgi:RND family efflux transporter MFP subunit
MPTFKSVAAARVRRVLFTAVLLTGWPGFTQIGTAAPNAEASPVSTMTVMERIVPEWSEYHGMVASRNQVHLIALVSGRVKAVHATTGQRVRKGQVLVELEQDDLRARLHAAESRLANTQANLVEAGKEHDRYTQLAAQGVVSAQMLDKSTARLMGAQAAAAEARAGVNEARTMLDYTVLRSPINGIVTDKRINPGDFTMPGLPSEIGFPSGRNLMTIYDPGALWFEARIPERFSPHVSVGTKAGVVIASANLKLDGKFVEVLPVVDESTRSFTARVNLPAHPALKLGMFGRARFATGQRTVIEIPENAVIERGQLDGVFIHSAGKAHLRLIRLGKRNSGNVEILSGLAAGEKVILNPRANLRDGDTL